jgi:hypothetical protein
VVGSRTVAWPRTHGRGTSPKLPKQASIDTACAHVAEQTGRINSVKTRLPNCRSDRVNVRRVEAALTATVAVHASPVGADQSDRQVWRTK